MKPLLFPFFCLFFIHAAESQTVTCKIIDRQQQPVPFVSVLNRALKMGTISDINGFFTLDARPFGDTGRLYFSCVGYESFAIRFADLAKQPSPRTIMLSEKTYEVAAVEIKADLIKYKRVQEGFDVRSDAVQLGYFNKEEDLGEEIGVVMRNTNDCFVDRIGLNFASLSHDSVEYEVQLYQWNDEGPGEFLNRERIFITIRQERIRGPFYIDFSEQPIRVNSDFMVSVKAIRSPDGRDYGGMFSSKLLAKSRTFRKTDSGEWKKEPVNISIFTEMRCRRE